MDTLKHAAKILVVGNDSRLAYLLNRYAGQCGLDLTNIPSAHALTEIRKTHPNAILFSSLEVLQEAQAWLAELGDLESKILVCAAVGEDAVAREMGVDGCLLHPLTYDGFVNALASSCGA